MMVPALLGLTMKFGLLEFLLSLKMLGLLEESLLDLTLLVRNELFFLVTVCGLI